VGLRGGLAGNRDKVSKRAKGKAIKKVHLLLRELTDMGINLVSKKGMTGQRAVCLQGVGKKRRRVEEGFTWAKRGGQAVKGKKKNTGLLYKGMLVWVPTENGKDGI